VQTNNLLKLEQAIKKQASAQHALALQRFFKTGKDQYGEGDIFIGLRNPQCRKIALTFKHLTVNEIKELIKSPVHEKRLIALLILIHHYKLALKTCNELLQKDLVNFYIYAAKKNYVNNWDLVDLSAPLILGNYLLNKNKKLLYTLAKTNHLWLQRISIISTLYFIKHQNYTDTFAIAKILLNHKHDLIHKATGWMLRETGKKDSDALELFLAKHYKIMPRTMLRYAIEKFSENKRKLYLNGLV